MAKSTEELANSRAGATAESNGFGSAERPQRPGGVYRLKDKEGNVVDEQIVKSHPVFGDSQAAAFERVGYEYVREAKPGEVKEMEIVPNPGLSGDHSEDLKGLQARISQVETLTKNKDDEIAALRAELAKRDGDTPEAQDSSVTNVDEVRAKQSADTKAEAVARTEVRSADAQTQTSAPQTGEGNGAAETDKVEELKQKAAEKQADGDSSSSDEKENSGAAKGTTTTPANSNQKKGN